MEKERRRDLSTADLERSAEAADRAVLEGDPVAARETFSRPQPEAVERQRYRAFFDRLLKM